MVCQFDAPEKARSKANRGSFDGTGSEAMKTEGNPDKAPLQQALAGSPASGRQTEQ